MLTRNRFGRGKDGATWGFRYGSLFFLFVALLASLSLCAEERNPRPNQVEIVRSLLEKASQVKTLTCTVTEQFFSSTGTQKGKKYRLWLAPEGRRKEIGPADQPDEIEIELATCSWHMARKDVRKTCWGYPVRFLPTPVLEAQSGGGLEQCSYLGLQNIGGTPCQVFGTEMFEWSFGADDGLMRRKIQKPLRGNTTPTTFTQTFGDMQINPTLDPKLFFLDPPEGSWVTEAWPQRNGVASEGSRLVPYLLPKGSPEQQAITTQKLGEMRIAFSGVNNFSSQYQFKETRHYEKVGPPPGTSPTSVRPDTDDETYWTIPQTEQNGTLTWEKPNRLAYHFSELSNVYPPKPDQFLLQDGVTRWTTQPLGGAQASGPVPVVQENLARKQQFNREIAILAEKQQAIARRFQEPGRQTRVYPPSALEAREVPYGVRLPDFLFEPFRKVATAALLFAGEEPSGGVETLKFNVFENEGNRKMTLWIGKKDGVPRRIEEYDWMGAKLETTIVLSEVIINQTIASETFRWKPDSHHQIIDLGKDLGAGYAMAREVMDMPPEKTFAAFFSTPVTEISELRGSGMGFMGGEYYIRFKCPGKVVLSKDPGFSPTVPKEAAAYFAKLFPEDEKLLQDSESLSARSYETQGEGSMTGAVLLINSKAQVYFFRYYYAH